MRHPWNSQLFAAGALASGRDHSTVMAARVAAAAIKQKDADLPVVFSLAHLAHLADVNREMLVRIVRREDDPYRVFRVKKRPAPGGIKAPRRHRTICVPAVGLMRAQRWIAQNILNFANPHPASFAFQPGRNLIDAAQKHADCRWLLKMDVVDFFESISERQVYWIFRSLGYGALVSFEFARLCTRQHPWTSPPVSLGIIGSVGVLPYARRTPGHLPQGAPTSPMLANLVMRDLDSSLEGIAHRLGWTYTRYADDLAFSHLGGSSRGDAMALAALVEIKLKAKGMLPNRVKTVVSPPGARKVLLGVMVDRERPRLSKEFRNNLETHIYALTHPSIGARAHKAKRGFVSVIGMRNHVTGLLSFAHQVDPDYASKLNARFANVDWSR